MRSLIRRIGAKTFYLKDGVWTDSLYKEGMEEKKVKYLSKEYFDLLTEKPELGAFLSLGEKVIVCIDSVAIIIHGDE